IPTINPPPLRPTPPTAWSKLVTWIWKPNIDITPGVVGGAFTIISNGADREIWLNIPAPCAAQAQACKVYVVSVELKFRTNETDSLAPVPDIGSVAQTATVLFSPRGVHTSGVDDPNPGT